MRKALKLLIVLMVFSISGCGWFTEKIEPEPVIKVKTIYVFNECPKPKLPNYMEMAPDSHLGSAFNINILIGNAEKMKTYNKSLLGSLECYDKQSKEHNGQ